MGRQSTGIQEGDLVTVLGRKMKALTKAYQREGEARMEKKDAQETDATQLSNQGDVGMKPNVLGQWIAGYLPAASKGVGCFSTHSEPPRSSVPQGFNLRWKEGGRSSPRIIIWRSKADFL